MQFGQYFCEQPMPSYGTPSFTFTLTRSAFEGNQSLSFQQKKKEKTETDTHKLSLSLSHFPCLMMMASFLASGAVWIWQLAQLCVWIQLGIGTFLLDPFSGATKESEDESCLLIVSCRAW